MFGGNTCLSRRGTIPPILVIAKAAIAHQTVHAPSVGEYFSTTLPAAARVAGRPFAVVAVPLGVCQVSVVIAETVLTTISSPRAPPGRRRVSAAVVEPLVINVSVPPMSCTVLPLAGAISLRTCPARNELPRVANVAISASLMTYRRSATRPRLVRLVIVTMQPDRERDRCRNVRQAVGYAVDQVEGVGHVAVFIRAFSLRDNNLSHRHPRLAASIPVVIVNQTDLPAQLLALLARHRARVLLDLIEGGLQRRC